MKLACRALVAASMVLASAGVAVGTATTANAAIYGSCSKSEEGQARYIPVWKDGHYVYIWVHCRNGWWQDW